MKNSSTMSKLWNTLSKFLSPDTETLDKMFSLGERPFYDEESVRKYANGEEIYQEPEHFKGEDPWFESSNPYNPNSENSQIITNEQKSKNTKMSESNNSSVSNPKNNNEKTKSESKEIDQLNKNEQGVNQLINKAKSKDNLFRLKIKSKISLQNGKKIKKLFPIKPKKLISLLNKKEEKKDKKVKEQNQINNEKVKKKDIKKQKAIKAEDIIYRNELEIEAPKEEETISTKLEENLKRIKKTFNMPDNADVIIREFSIDIDNPIPAAAIYIEGMGDRTVINDNILTPLMVIANVDGVETKDGFLKNVVKHLVPANQIEVKYNYEDIIKGVCTGNTAIIIEGHVAGILVESKGYPKKGVEKATNEITVRGPQEGFTDHLRTNTALVRKRLKDKNLVTEMIKIGERSNTDVAVLYIKDITNSKLVFEIRRRLKEIKIDSILDSSSLEQIIDPNPYRLFPSSLITERPDRVCNFLIEGSLAIMVDGDPFVIVLPITVISLLHTSEDAYLRWPFATFIRWFRVIASFMAILVPAIYISVTDYHPEMIPTDLLLAIASARETVPYPVWIEVMIMEGSFELIREAGLRIPSPIGPTIGIVGAIILGQAAVTAGIVSPILVVIVALTALGSFAIPSYVLSFSFRILRFIFILLGIMFGFYGIGVGLSILVFYLVSQQSFGVPYFSGIAPYYPNHEDYISRSPFWMHTLRPRYLRTKEAIRQKQFNRPWDATFEDINSKKNGGSTDE